MTATVVLYTSRTEFATEWQNALRARGVDVRAEAPDAVAETLSAARGALFDAASDAFDEDELLACVGLARALGRTAAVSLEGRASLGDVDDVLSELCAGLISRTHDDVTRIAAGLARRCDKERAGRIEYVAVSPRGSELVVILADGTPGLLTRPVAADDDGSEITAIEMAEDASTARIGFASGKQATLRALELGAKLRREDSGGNSGLNPADIDGVRLGQRLRSLRLAAGLTQAELARRTGIHRPNIARVEAGRHTPSLETLSRLASAIGVPATRVLAD